MQYISENMEFQLQNTAVSLGKFDGIHKGHQLLINQIIEEKKKGYTSVVFTFSLHPRSLFSDKELELIDTEEEKLEKLQKLGVDVLISYPFTKETASTEPEDFIKEVLVKQMDAKIIVVGTDYRFGKDRRGDVAMLQAMSNDYGYEVIVFDKLKIKDEIVSSTLIRSEIAKGNMEFVASLMGEAFRIDGEVIYGNQIGRTIGMPTINQTTPLNKLLPPNGVYVSKVHYNGTLYTGVTNIGCKPTVTDKNIKGVETYILDFNENVYGKEIEVELLHFIRPEQKFHTLNELKAQIRNDIETARNYLKQEESENNLTCQL